MSSGLLATALLLLAVATGVEDGNSPDPLISWPVASEHFIGSPRGFFPVEGAQEEFSSLHLDLVVSAEGRVVGAKASGEVSAMKFWPQIRPEVLAWTFIPFKRNGHAIRVRLQRYIQLVPPTQWPTKHVPAPLLKADSVITISLERGACFGTCPVYTVTLTKERIVFNGQRYVAEMGQHVTEADSQAVESLAKKFISSDFYSMEDRYVASVTDMPSQVLTIQIDGQRKQVVDYVGMQVGMPPIIDELEYDVDQTANTRRWIMGLKAWLSSKR